MAIKEIVADHAIQQITISLKRKVDASPSQRTLRIGGLEVMTKSSLQRGRQD
jgi:hypothetical protein